MNHKTVLKAISGFLKDNKRPPTKMYISPDNMYELLGQPESHEYMGLHDGHHWYYGLRVVRVDERNWFEVV